MVEFGKRLQEECEQHGEEWQRHCIDYNTLKSIIVESKQQSKKQTASTSPSAATTTTNITTKHSRRNKNRSRTISFDASRNNNYLLLAFLATSDDDDEDDCWEDHHQDGATTFAPGYHHHDGSTVESSQPTTSVMQLSSLQFRYALDREIEKAVLYVLQTQGNIARELDRLAIQRAAFADTTYTSLVSSSSSRSEDSHNNNNNNNNSSLRLMIHAALNELQDLHSGYIAAARSILRFVSFVDLNVTAVRKILKKYDKLTKSTKLSNAYLSAYTNEYVDSHLDQLFNERGLSSLVVTLKRAFLELYHIECTLLTVMHGSTSSQITIERGGYSELEKGNNTTIDKKNKHRRIQTDGGLFSCGGGGGMRTSQQQKQQQHERNMSSSLIRSTTTTETLITTKNEPLLQLIQMSRDKLKQNTHYIEFVAAQALLFETGSDTDGDSTTGEQRKVDASLMSNTQKVSSMLNLLSTFLYMTNYYIVAPTCGHYAESVGGSESLAGVVIGMTPNAALVATVLYAWWSNHSYKSALIFAISCSLLGNVFYAMALSYDSITMVMAGRILNGFGSARSINRRFIADSFTKKDRTAASASFVTAAALGMSCGPALAAMLSKFSYSSDSKLWTEVTAPGWVMLFLWSVFLVVFVVFFEDPDRSSMYGNKSTLELTAKSSGNDVGEGKYLLAADNTSTEDIVEKRDPPIYKNVPVMMTLWIYFILKLVLECLLSSCPTLTSYYFDWESTDSGLFLAFLGLLMFPANMFVAKLSHRYEDRELINAALIIMLCSIVGFIAYTAKYSVIQYMLFGICIFISTNCLEGPNMALLSKSIPKSFAKGTFNAGFLATEAGTLARSIGDVLITLAHHASGISGMLDATFVPMLGLVVVSVLLTRRYYNQMAEEDDEDAKSD